MHIIETDRLLIEPFTLPDAGFILALTNTPGWLAFIGDRGIRNIADAENYISNGPMISYAAHGHGLSRVSLKETGEPIGMCGLLQRNTLRHKDIGFAFLPEYTGKGYALEAATAVMQHATATLGIDCVAAVVLAANTRSIALLSKIGFVFEKMIRFPPNEEELMLFVKSPGHKN
jgi:[ribosomal protein S5]-alanine N-acetyltransferase